MIRPGRWRDQVRDHLWGTDDLGYAAVENPVSVHDFHATMLHLLGIDHRRLTVKFQGLDARLTDISGEVVKDILGFRKH